MNDDQDDDKLPMIPAGDLGTILLAAVFLVAFLFLMFGPSPFQGLVNQAKQAPPQTGEVSVGLPAEKPKN